jgi:hypothetical protein
MHLRVRKESNFLVPKDDLGYLEVELLMLSASCFADKIVS